MPSIRTDHTRAPMLRLLSSLACSLGAGRARPRPRAAQGRSTPSGVGPVNPVAAKTARRVGDILTIIIEEKQNITNDEKADLKKRQ